MDPLDELGPDRPRYKDHPEFEPTLSPGAMLAAGVFGGGYFHGWDDEQLEGIDPKILARGPHRDEPDDKGANAFGVHSGQSLATWRRNGWIRDQDPVGWFQWYCRFHSGRRTDDDARQIARWIDFRKRWKPKTKEALQRMNPGAGTRQALLHWAVDPWLPEHSLGIRLTSGREREHAHG